MRDIIVCSYATHRTGLLDEYESQLEAAGVDFHLCPVTLPDGINSVTARWKFEFIQRMCLVFSDYRRIVFTDAWDVLFSGTKNALRGKIPDYPLVSAERNCWPEVELADKISSGPTPWRFANAGMISGSPYRLSDWVYDALQMPELDIMEQAWLNRRLAEHSRDFYFPVDSGTELFYTVSEGEELPLKVTSRGVYNTATDACPQFFHFSGKCSSVPFRRMLRTGE